MIIPCAWLQGREVRWTPQLLLLLRSTLAQAMVSPQSDVWRKLGHHKKLGCLSFPFSLPRGHYNAVVERFWKGNALFFLYFL